jgi:hypothetical protein
MSTFQFILSCVVGIVMLATVAALTPGRGTTNPEPNEDGGDDDARTRVDRAVTHDHGSIDRFGNHDDY